MALSKKQKVAIETLIANPFIKNDELAKVCGVHPSTSSKWKQDPEFQAEWDRKMDEQWAEAIKKAKKKAMDLMDSTNDNVSLGATKLVLDKCMADKHEVEADGGININISYGDNDE